MLMAIDETDSIFRTDFSNDFFAMLRNWNSLRANPLRRGWKKLDIVVSTSTEPQFFIERRTSRRSTSAWSALDDFEPGEVLRLNALHPGPLDDSAIHGSTPSSAATRASCAGALRARQSSPDRTLDELFDEASEDSGPFGDDLRDYLLRIQRKPELIAALRQATDDAAAATTADRSPRGCGPVAASATMSSPAAISTHATSASGFMRMAEPYALSPAATSRLAAVFTCRGAPTTNSRRCLAGDFTFILTSRQMGKSSLIIRTPNGSWTTASSPSSSTSPSSAPRRPPSSGTRGSCSACRIDAGLRTPAAEWWARQLDHSFAHKFTRYFREVALKERSERLVVLVDEIDTTLRLDFTDDFFAAIRFLYQQRAAEPDLQRLSFVLIGVATPGDLIKDTTRTPFNIGHRIELTDFTLDEASVLADHLAVPEPMRRDLIRGFCHWTNGHPYLTLRAIRSLADSPRRPGPPAWSTNGLSRCSCVGAPTATATCSSSATC